MVSPHLTPGTAACILEAKISVPANSLTPAQCPQFQVSSLEWVLWLQGEGMWTRWVKLVAERGEVSLFPLKPLSLGLGVRGRVSSGTETSLCLSWGHWRPCLLRRGGGILALCPQALGCGGQGEHCPVLWSHPDPPSWRCGLSVGHPDVLRAQGSRTEGGSPGMSEGWGWVQRPLIHCPGGLVAGLCQEQQPRSLRSCADLVLAAPGVRARASRDSSGIHGGRVGLPALSSAPSLQVFQLAAHLVYWGKAIVIYPLCENNVYMLSPNASVCL